MIHRFYVPLENRHTMKRTLFLLLILCLILTSCGTAEAEHAADQFHEKLDAGDYEWIVDNMIYEEDLEVTPRESWLAFFELVESWGKITNRQRVLGFSNKINNGVTTSKLSYTFDTPLGFMYERIVLVDRGKGFKLLMISMNQKESVVEADTAGY